MIIEDNIWYFFHGYSYDQRTYCKVKMRRAENIYRMLQEHDFRV